jgi:hypothetical protein
LVIREFALRRLFRCHKYINFVDNRQASERNLSMSQNVAFAEGEKKTFHTNKHMVNPSKIILFCALSANLAHAQTSTICASAMGAQAGVFTIGEVLLTPVDQTDIAQTGLISVLAPLLLVDTKLLGEENTVQVFPNPFQQSITISGIKTTPSSLYTLTITDLQGRVLVNRSLASEAEVLQLGAWPAGVYFITCKTNDHTTIYHTKLLKYE